MARGALEERATAGTPPGAADHGRGSLEGPPTACNPGRGAARAGRIGERVLGSAAMEAASDRGSPIRSRWAAASLVLALLGAASLAGCAAPLPQREVPSSEATPIHNAVMERVRAYYGDLSARDWERLAGHFWPRAQLSTIWQAAGQERPEVNSVSIEEFIERAPEGPGSQPIFEERLVQAEVRVFGPLAQVWALYDARFGSTDDLREWRGMDAITLLHHDGGWRIISIAYAAEQ